MPKKNKTKKNKSSALAASASKKLQGGKAAPQYSPDQIAHAMMHAEENGDAERVDLGDGSWGWKVMGPGGKPQILKPTPEMLAALERFEKEGHPAHDHDDE